MHRTGRQVIALCLGATVAALASVPARADVTIHPAPLFLGGAVPPAIIIALDNSTSMDTEILINTNDGALWWNTTVNRFTGLDLDNVDRGDGRFNFNRDGRANVQWRKFTYLFPNGVSSPYGGRRIDADALGDHFAVPPTPEFAYTRSPVYNKLYFHPAEVYEPWPGFGDVTPSAAPSDPVIGDFTYDVTRVRTSQAANWNYRYFTGMVIQPGVECGPLLQPSSTREWVPSGVHGETRSFCGEIWEYDESRGGWVLLDADEGTSLATSLWPATFYLPEGEELPEDFGYSVEGLRLPGSGPAGDPLVGYRIMPENFISTEHYDRAIQNFANWFTYHRKRLHGSRGSLLHALQGVSGMRIGLFTINNPVTPVMLDLNDPADREALYEDIMNVVPERGGTPNKQAVLRMGGYFQNPAVEAILHSCQRNVGVLFTDGYSITHSPAGIGNEDGPFGAPFADDVSGTMADIAMHFYAGGGVPLQGGFTPGQVPVQSGCDADNPDPRLDCVSDLHMNFYGITLGTVGLLFDPENPIDPFGEPVEWPTEFPDRHPSAIDDIWHATINARGDLLLADRPRDVADALSEIIARVRERDASSSGLATNSTRLDTDTHVYQARFNSRDWTGTLKAFALTSDGRIAAEAWDLATRLDARPVAERNMLVWTGAGAAAFLWDNLTAEQQDVLDRNRSGLVDGLGSQRLNWLRGDRDEERANSGPFRDRGSVIGDMIHSNPVYVGGPESFGFDRLGGGLGSSYRDYLAAKSAMGPTIYVGANDGMLHAVNALTGDERFAYVPGVFLKDAARSRLNALPEPGYDHRYYVDGQLYAADAYFATGDGAPRWRTVLVGAAGAGERVLFAIDITDPDVPEVLWEVDFETAGLGTQLGHVYGAPRIVRVADDGSGAPGWVVVTGNGYNSAADSASLLMLDIATGEPVKLINTGAAGDNGLGPVSLVVDAATLELQHAYAGDLQGNVWKFDLGGSTGDWAVAFGGEPLFTALDPDGEPQPITAPVSIRNHGEVPDGGYLVAFGTGSYFRSEDVNPYPQALQVQSLYGIFDDGNEPVSNGGRYSELVEQSILSETDVTGTTYRLTSSNDVDWNSDKGWYMDLVSPVAGTEGERVITNVLLRRGKAIFLTFIPAAETCGGGSASYVMVVDALTGARATDPVLDVNGDREFDDGDLLTNPQTGEGEPDRIPASGVKLDPGAMRQGSAMTAGQFDVVIYTDLDGNLQPIALPGATAPPRASWRQLRFQR